MHRGLSATYLKKEVSTCGQWQLEVPSSKKGFIALESTQDTRDPLRAASENLRIALKELNPPGKLPKAERELVAFLSLHPGTHNLAEVEQCRSRTLALPQ